MFEPTVGLLAAAVIEKTVYTAISENKPLSLVRCGDGESVVLGYPEFVHKNRFAAWMANFFGAHADASRRFEPLRAQLEWAISTADVVGTFRERVRDIEHSRAVALRLGAKSDLSNAEKLELSQIEWRLLNHLTKPLLNRRALLTGTNVHIRMEESGLLRSIFETAKRVNVITGNDIAARLQAAFPDTDIVQTRVPTEYKFESSRGGWDQAEPHFPTVFERVMAEIRRGDFEGVTLIGAGPCGKVYASAIKEAGGIGIDVGSILDVWAGRHTRSFMQTMRRRTLPDEGEAQA